MKIKLNSSYAMEKLDQAIFHVQKIEVEQYQLRNLSRVYVYLIPKEEK